jgi:hypothetical protein
MKEKDEHESNVVSYVGDGELLTDEGNFRERNFKESFQLFFCECLMTQLLFQSILC